MALTKVTSGVRTLGTGEVTSTNILDGTIENVDVSATAAIASTKLSGVESGLASVQTFTSSGTWTRPSGITKVIVHVVGAGGGGGAGRSAYQYTGTGGGAGGTAIKFINVSSISTATVTIGAAASSAAVDANGSDGGDSSWADGTNTVTGNGGDGGWHGGYDNYEPGGTASGGDINATGGSGSPGAGANVSNMGAGQGGICANGFGGGPGAMERTTLDNDATGYGHGGSGGATGGTGGESAPGIVVVWEYK